MARYDEMWPYGKIWLDMSGYGWIWTTIKVWQGQGDMNKDKMIMILMRNLPIRETLINAFKQSGATHKTGPPPPGYLERELSSWADNLTTAGG